jgi:hypothetical protein
VIIKEIWVARAKEWGGRKREPGYFRSKHDISRWRGGEEEEEVGQVADKAAKFLVYGMRVCKRFEEQRIRIAEGRRKFQIFWKDEKTR